MLKDGRTILEDEGLLDPVTAIAARSKENSSKYTAKSDSNVADSLECCRVVGIRHDSQRRLQGWRESRRRRRQHRARQRGHGKAACGRLSRWTI